MIIKFRINWDRYLGNSFHTLYMKPIKNNAFLIGIVHVLYHLVLLLKTVLAYNVGYILWVLWSSKLIRLWALLKHKHMPWMALIESNVFWSSFQSLKNLFLYYINSESHHNFNGYYNCREVDFLVTSKFLIIF